MEKVGVGINNSIPSASQYVLAELNLQRIVVLWTILFQIGMKWHTNHRRKNLTPTRGTYRCQSSMDPFLEKYIRLHHALSLPVFHHHTLPSIFPSKGFQ